MGGHIYHLGEITQDRLTVPVIPDKNAKIREEFLHFFRNDISGYSPDSRIRPPAICSSILYGPADCQEHFCVLKENLEDCLQNCCLYDIK